MNSTPDLYQTIARLHLGKARKQSVSFTLREQKITQEAMESATGSNLTPSSKALSEDDKVLVRDTWREATKPEREAGQKLFKRRVLCADRLWCRYRTRSVGWDILMFQAYYLQSTSIFFFYLLTVRPTLCFTLSNSMLFHVNKLIFLIILQVKSNFWMITKESDCCDGSNFQCHVICKLWMDSMPVSNLTPDWLALTRHSQCLLPCARS